jgi:hypothetical protein
MNFGVGVPGSRFDRLLDEVRPSVISFFRNRLLAELLEQGIRSTLVIPVHKPQVLAAGTLSSGQRIPGIEGDPRNVGLNPTHYLQHPGYYYYAGARCTEMRRVKFQAALEAEVSHYFSELIIAVVN